MRLTLIVAAATLVFTLPAHGADAGALVAAARQRIEATDARGTGHLVRVGADGQRISNAITLKAHWFPGVLRVLLEIVPARQTGGGPHPNAARDARVSVLFEMRPGGQSTVQMFHPGERAPASLPFDRWGEGVLGTDFNYEDFLQQELYWQSQILLKSAKIGTHDCDVLKSTPDSSNRTHYAAVQTWLDQTTGYPIYTEKTLKDAHVVKEFTSLGLTRSGGVWSARQVEVKVHGRPGSSLLIFDRGSTQAHLTAKDFSPEQIGRFEDQP